MTIKFYECYYIKNVFINCKQLKVDLNKDNTISNYKTNCVFFFCGKLHSDAKLRSYIARLPDMQGIKSKNFNLNIASVRAQG